MPLRRPARIVLASLAVLIAAIMALPWLIPLDTYRALAEEKASTAIGAPVRIGGMRAHLVPLPHVTLGGIEVGTPPDIRIDAVVVSPALLSMLSSDRVIRSVAVEGVQLEPGGLDRLAALGKSDGGPAPVRVEKVSLRDVVLIRPAAKIGPFDGDIALGPNGAMTGASVRTTDGALKAALTPAAQGMQATIDGKGWTLPLGAPVRFDTLAVRIEVNGDRIHVASLEAALYGGTAKGEGTIDIGKSPAVRADVALSGIGLANLVPLFTTGTRLSGQLDAKVAITGRAKEVAGLADALRIEAPFDIRNGVLHGVDVAAAARILVKTDATGGETRFDKLSGHVVRQGGALRLSRLVIASGVLDARGNVEVSARSQLSGRIFASLKAGVTLAEVPLNVSGTVAQPSLLPTGAAIAGGAAGTAVLGPGLGTAVGVRAGALIDRVFGRGDK
jgi:uncharacterized protein involved in outer membrane biogenesis